ncbi:Zinc homeostasis factor 1 [Colletotrichum tanaceti]|uniref:Zinc homeostasis factor 1 n=1 Tax=Colletotrichum tanaceti TaxID=1306861 RepID=A0A4U6X703_9PEZI|nr:Zinc homeostasis factor 1 [Colletotrichum tanaceti]
MRFHVTRKQRLVATIAISGGFFVAELVVGFRTKSLALIADAFHYSKQTTPDSKQEDIKREHRGRDLGMLGVMIHVIGDAINNVGIIVAAVVIWKGEGNGRFYADPGVSLFIALSIMGSAWPLCKRAGHILLESMPPDLSLDDIRAEITKVSAVESVADLRIWRIDQRTMLATAHVIVTDDSVNSFNSMAAAIGAGLRPYGIQSIALQPIRQRPVTPAAVGHESASDISEVSKAA